jgi:replicative DNA helicase
MPKQKEQQRLQEVGTSHSTETEHSALANVLIAGDSCKLLQMLEPEDFYDPAAREVWEVMKKIHEGGNAVDFVSVCDEIRNGKVVNPAILAGLLSRVEHLSADESIYRILKRHRASRESIGVYREALGKPIEDIPKLMSDQGKRIADMLPRRPEENFGEILEELSGTEDRIKTYIDFADWCYEGGLSREALHIFAGRPGTGKSSLMTTFCAQWIRHKVPFCFISLEMSRKEVLTRILCSYHKMTAKEIRGDAKELSEVFREASFNVIVGSGSIQAVQNAILTAEEPIIIVDHLGLITDPGASNKVQEVSNVTRMLKLCSMEVQKPILACHQMSRAIEHDKGNREPRLSDLRDSGTVEQDADNVTFLWDPHAKDDAMESIGQTQKTVRTDKEIRFIVRKQRNGPSDLYRTLNFHMPHFTLEESERDDTADRVKKAAVAPEELPF